MNSYLQIYNSTKDRILKGDLKPGAKLPAHREMCGDYSVSIATVTRAINKLKKEGWVESYRGLGTIVSEPAEPPVRPTSKTVCFITFMQQFQNEAFSYAVQEVFAGSKWSLNSRCTHSNLEWYRDFLQDCHNNPPAGMILLTMHPSMFAYTPELLPHPSTQVVLIDHEIPGRTYDMIRSNKYSNCALMAEYLTEKGYRDCVFLSDARQEELATTPALPGFSTVFSQHGIQFGMEQVWRFENPHSFGPKLDPFIDSYTYVKERLTRERPQVIMAGHDWCAAGAIRAVLDSGLSIPKDIAVVSMGTSVDLSAITSTPKITGVDSLFSFQMATAAQLLKRRLEGDDSPIIHHHIHGRIREGETA
jgi:DNA-binding LacI/PurR family transcriptional regulator